MIEALVIRNDLRFGEAFQKLRKRGGVSQRGLASLLEWDQSNITKLEAGNRNPVRKISFYEDLATANWLNKDDVAQLLLTKDAPRWLEPDKDQLPETIAEFGRLLRFYRERAGFSQMKFAGEYIEEIDGSTINRIEHGSRNPPHDSQFYDRLPEILNLNQKEYAGLLLTGRPPRWLVPYLYDAIGVNDANVSARPLIDIKRAGVNGLNIRISGDMSNFTDERLSDLGKIIDNFLLSS